MLWIRQILYSQIVHLYLGGLLPGLYRGIKVEPVHYAHVIGKSPCFIPLSVKYFSINVEGMFEVSNDGLSRQLEQWYS